MTDPVAPPAQPVPAAPIAGPKQTLSLVSFILGLAGLIFSWVPVFGFLASLAAIIIGFIGRKREPAAPHWMWLVGIIAGFVALVIGFIVIAIFIVGIIAQAAVLGSIGSVSN